MKRQFLTTKVVEVEEMTRKEYYNFRNWDFPQRENPDEKVFLVEYSDGYISMCHRNPFQDSLWTRFRSIRTF